MVYLILFILGLCVGSFLNVIIYRETNDKGKSNKISSWLPSWVIGRSYCDYCKKQLSWYDNIPLLSYVLLKGRCRYCHKKISWQYPLVELLTGIEFVWIYFLIQSNLTFFSRFEGFYSFLNLLVYLILGACFLIIFVADLKYQIIPDTAIVLGFLISLFKVWVDYRYTAIADFSVFAAALISGLFFLALVLITREKGMGWGDVKLAFLLGLVLGIPRIFLALFFAFLTGAAVGVILILFGKKKLKSKICFGPFLIMGAIVALFCQEQILYLLIYGFRR